MLYEKRHLDFPWLEGILTYFTLGTSTSTSTSTRTQLDLRKLTVLVVGIRPFDLAGIFLVFGFVGL